MNVKGDHSIAPVPGQPEPQVVKNDTIFDPRKKQITKGENKDEDEQLDDFLAHTVDDIYKNLCKKEGEGSKEGGPTG